MQQTLIDENFKQLKVIGHRDGKGFGVQIQIEQDSQDAYIDLSDEEVNTLIWALRNEVEPDLLDNQRPKQCILSKR
jgi:hypothetical protein